jgi:GAF domain-containing protein
MPDRERLAREQAALAELGRRIVAPSELGRVLQDAVELVATAVEVEHATVLELSADGMEVRLRAGVGWEARDIGHRIDAMPGGHVHYVLQTPDPVIVDDLAAETRFAISPVLVEAGVRASLGVRIPGAGALPFGVIGVHTSRDRAFTPEDGQFLMGVANVLASAISRHRRAVEMNDEILQTLVLAQYALRQGREDAGALLERAIGHTRTMISRLLGESEAGTGTTLPGDLRRQTPPEITERP